MRLAADAAIVKGHFRVKHKRAATEAAALSK